MPDRPLRAAANQIEEVPHSHDADELFRVDHGQ
jgi:hypothetical protein